jgi:hypothetical protein
MQPKITHSQLSDMLKELDEANSVLSKDVKDPDQVLGAVGRKREITKLLEVLNIIVIQTPSGTKVTGDHNSIIGEKQSTLLAIAQDMRSIAKDIEYSNEEAMYRLVRTSDNLVEVLRETGVLVDLKDGNLYFPELVETIDDAENIKKRAEECHEEDSEYNPFSALLGAIIMSMIDGNGDCMCPVCLLRRRQEAAEK